MTFQEMVLGDVYFTLILTGVFAAIGIGTLIYGISLSRRAVAPFPLRENWKRYILPFLGKGAPDAADAEAMRSAEQRWLRIQAGGTIGGSIGILAGVAGMAAAIIAAAYAPFGLPVSVLPLFFMPVFLGILAGRTLGEVVASRRQVSSTDESGLAGSEPSRRVSDYRSPLVLLVVALPFVILSALVLIMAPRFAASLQYSAHEYSKYSSIVSPRGILVVSLCMGLALLVVAEMCVWVKVKLIAAIRLRDAALARRLHTRVIGQCAGMAYVAAMLHSTVMGAGILVLFALWLDDVTFAACIGISIVLCVIGAGMLVPANRGRLGGRLTGWPWTGGASQDGAEAARGDGVV